MIASGAEVIAVLGALVSVGCAVASAFIVRRGSDTELKADVNELAGFVEKLSRETRKERMRAVRRGEKVAGSQPVDYPIPPGAEALAPAEPQITSKADLRRAMIGRRLS